jgi:hypothetical protein
MMNSSSSRLDLSEEYKRLQLETVNLVRENAALLDQLQEWRYLACFDPETGDVISIEDFYQLY